MTLFNGFIGILLSSFSSFPIRILLINLDGIPYRSFKIVSSSKSNVCIEIFNTPFSNNSI